ncbi:hypothetical protein EZY14_011320 [Kordia sp. TARA_039_SRF]|jgi:hypothetical protein|nr:hypothetical protein EZY14_011320 [Kordia sp. TARA_039_SRF]
MKKRNLSTLKLRKATVSTLTKEATSGGFTSFWSCHSDMSECLCSGVPGCPMPLQTNEGPCPGGTAGCNTTHNQEP